jgi:anaerobic ribonucleoside-triphosphate reductase activating protein
VREAGKTVWTYTGYTYEQLTQGVADHPAWKTLLDNTDVLIDGPFLERQKSMDLRFRGSRNQRILVRRGGGWFLEEAGDDGGDGGLRRPAL